MNSSNLGRLSSTFSDACAPFPTRRDYPVTWMPADAAGTKPSVPECAFAGISMRIEAVSTSKSGSTLRVSCWTVNGRLYIGCCSEEPVSSSSKHQSMRMCDNTLNERIKLIHASTLRREYRVKCVKILSACRSKTALISCEPKLTSKIRKTSNSYSNSSSALNMATNKERQPGSMLNRLSVSSEYPVWLPGMSFLCSTHRQSIDPWIPISALSALQGSSLVLRDSCPIFLRRTPHIWTLSSRHLPCSYWSTKSSENSSAFRRHSPSSTAHAPAPECLEEKFSTLLLFYIELCARRRPAAACTASYHELDRRDPPDRSNSRTYAVGPSTGMCLIVGYPTIAPAASNLMLVHY